MRKCSRSLSKLSNCGYSAVSGILLVVVSKFDSFSHLSSKSSTINNFFEYLQNLTKSSSSATRFPGCSGWEPKMPYISSDGSLVEKRSWFRLSLVSDIFWVIIDTIGLLGSTLIYPNRPIKKVIKQQRPRDTNGGGQSSYLFWWRFFTSAFFCMILDDRRVSNFDKCWQLHRLLNRI